MAKKKGTKKIAIYESSSKGNLVYRRYFWMKNPVNVLKKYNPKTRKVEEFTKVNK